MTSQWVHVIPELYLHTNKIIIQTSDKHIVHYKINSHYKASDHINNLSVRLEKDWTAKGKSLPKEKKVTIEYLQMEQVDKKVSGISIVPNGCHDEEVPHQGRVSDISRNTWGKLLLETFHHPRLFSWSKISTIMHLCHFQGNLLRHPSNYTAHSIMISRILSLVCLPYAKRQPKSLLDVQW
jgi:hypothetical protein